MTLLNDVVTVTGGTPTLTLNDGGTATYTGDNGTNALTFSYTVGAGQNTASLAATAVNLNGAIRVQNNLAMRPSCSVNGVTQTGPQIDTATPSVTSVATSGAGITAGTGDLPAGSIVTLTVNLSEAVTVAGGTPTLTLNDGGTATYTGGTGTSALTFSYTVGAGQSTADLAVTAFNAGTATIKDGAGNAANLTGAVTNPAGTLQIDTTTHIAQVGSNYFLDNINGSGPLVYIRSPQVAGRSSASGRRSQPCKRAVDTKSSGTLRAPTNIQPGTPTATAITPLTRSWLCLERAPRWNRWRRLSARI